MYSQITLKELRLHARGFMREECFECLEPFTHEAPIFNPDETATYLCERCYKELFYT